MLIGDPPPPGGADAVTAAGATPTPAGSGGKVMVRCGLEWPLGCSCYSSVVATAAALRRSWVIVSCPSRWWSRAFSRGAAWVGSGLAVDQRVDLGARKPVGLPDADVGKLAGLGKSDDGASPQGEEAGDVVGGVRRGDVAGRGTGCYSQGDSFASPAPLCLAVGGALFMLYGQFERVCDAGAGQCTKAAVQLASTLYAPV